MARIQFASELHRDGACGVWGAVLLSDGAFCAAMRLPLAATDGRTIERVLAATRDLMRADVPGIAPIADVAVGGDQVWMFVGIAPGPSLDDLIDNAVLTPADTALIAIDSGRTLVALHERGLRHGAFGLRTIVVSRGGDVHVTEAGLAPALAGTADRRGGYPRVSGVASANGSVLTGFGPQGAVYARSLAVNDLGGDPVRADTQAWAGVVRRLAIHLRGLGVGYPADVLSGCAEVANTQGLTVAIRRLSAAAQAFPGFPSRTRLQKVMTRFGVGEEPDAATIVRAINALFDADDAPTPTDTDSRDTIALATARGLASVDGRTNTEPPAMDPPESDRPAGSAPPDRSAAPSQSAAPTQLAAPTQSAPTMPRSASITAFSAATRRPWSPMPSRPSSGPPSWPLKSASAAAAARPSDASASSTAPAPSAVSDTPAASSAPTVASAAPASSAAAPAPAAERSAAAPTVVQRLTEASTPTVALPRGGSANRAAGAVPTSAPPAGTSSDMPARGAERAASVSPGADATAPLSVIEAPGAGRLDPRRVHRRGRTDARTAGPDTTANEQDESVDRTVALSRVRRMSVIPPRRRVNDPGDAAPSGLWAPKPTPNTGRSLRAAGTIDAPVQTERVLRIGHGVPALTARRPAPARLGSPTWWPRLAINIGLIVAIVLGVGGYSWWRLDRPLHVNAVSLTVQKQRASACHLDADVVGTVITSGGSGTFTYQWRRSDGTTTPVYTARVADPSKPTEVHLRWTFSGVGVETAQVALVVLGPQRHTARTSFDYICNG